MTNTGSLQLTKDDLYLFNEGSHFQLYDKMGAHPESQPGGPVTRFSVWAPNAEKVEVVGDFNGWSPSGSDQLGPVGDSGIWSGTIEGAGTGAIYKYRIHSRHDAYVVDKADPFAFRAEVPPATGSVVASLAHEWGDAEWMANRSEKNALGSPMSIYEVHTGSWRRVAGEGFRSLSYRELADSLVDHVKSLNFTHVEFLPLTEHPFFGSWGYQTTGYFAASSRFGEPADLMYLVDRLHQEDVGVIFDWVPSHFPSDEHGLGFFDGTHLFEHADPRLGHHKDWDSLIFNYGRNEVRSFLTSSAMFWLDKYHADGIRVDAVASMLYLDYSRAEGEWIPNEHGGRENLDAIHFLRKLNEAVYSQFPDTQTIAEESTSWPMVSRPTYLGGLGFGMKWDMGWMHDTLQYISREPIHRRFHHSELTFRSVYAFSENFVLPLSHDEVVHGKGSLLAKMPGDEWQRFANLRLLYSYMYALPGKKLMFMGAELAQPTEWNHDSELPWELTANGPNAGVQQLLADLNQVYREQPALHEFDCVPEGFEWVEANNSDESTFAFLRRGKDPSHDVLCVFNFTPMGRSSYRIGVPSAGRWKEILNSDSAFYGGSGEGNLGGIESAPIPAQGRYHSLPLNLPALAAVFFRRQ